MDWTKKWAVVLCDECGQKSRYYHLGSEVAEHIDFFENIFDKLDAAGFVEEFVFGHCKHGLVEVPEENWTADDWAELIGNEFEDQNRHKLVHIPKVMLDSMKQAGVSEEQCVKVMCSFAEEMLRNS